MSGYIYVIKSLHLYKIGRSKYLNKRIKAYKLYNPFGIETIYSVRVKDHERVERLLHTKYKDKRVSGEWFELKEEDLETLKQFLIPRMTSFLEKYEMF